MPVYNALDTISRSIQSFQNLVEELPSDYNINCKLYIVDDYSSDGTTQKINDLTKSLDNIFIINNDSNIGPGPSRNKALKLVKNGYIGFLDADDEIVASEYIDSFITGVNFGSDWITFNGWFCSGATKNSKYDFDRLVDSTEQLAIRCLRGELDGSVIFSIYSSKLIKSNGLQFSEGYYEDISFSYSALLLAKNRHISKNFAYKKHNISTSIVNTLSEVHVNGLINSWIEVDNNLKSYKILDEIDSHVDRMYGFYGCIANLISSIILSNSSHHFKIKLFNLLFLRVNSELAINKFEYKVETKKDKLVRYFCQNFPHKKDTFLADITSFYNNLFYKNA